MNVLLRSIYVLCPGARLLRLELFATSLSTLVTRDPRRNLKIPQKNLGNDSQQS